MTKEETLNAIREVLLWVHSGKQDISNGLEEIELINDTYTKELTEEVEEREIQLQGYKDCLQIREATIEEQRKTIEGLRKMIKN